MSLVADTMPRMRQTLKGTSTTAELLAKACAGDESAIETLIGQQEGRVYALARSILRTPEWAEDATQEALLRVVQNLSSTRHASTDFNAWVLSITRNVALDLWRKRRVRGEASFEETAIQAAPSAGEALHESPLDALIAREDAGWMAAAIETLPGPWREALVLRFYHGLEPAQIAKVVGVSPENVRIRLWRALRELRRQLTEE